MMKKLLLILLCLPMIGFGQGWEMTFGGLNLEGGRSVQQTTDGGYIIIGETMSFGNGFRDVYLIKTDGNGVQQWYKTFGGTGNDVGISVQQTSDGGYIISGEIYGINGFDIDVYLIKTDGNGVQQWYRTFGGLYLEAGLSVQQTTDGGYIITGYSNSFTNDPSSPPSHVYLIKTDGGGIEQWTKTFGGTQNDYGKSVQQTTDGGYIIIGETRSFQANNPYADVYLIKTDSQGDTIWTKIHGGEWHNDTGASGQQTSDGGYIITGSTNGFSDVWLIKTDSLGDSLWSKTFGGTNDDLGASVQQTTDGGYIITGRTASFGNGSIDVYLIKTDGNGVQQWYKTFGGTNDDLGNSVQQTTDGGYIITGITYSFGNGNADVYLIKTDGNGNVTSTFNIPINPNRKLQKRVDVLGKETKPQTNTPFIEIYDDGTVEKRIVIE